MNDWFRDGTVAEYCLAPVSFVTLKPRSLTHAEAATVPIGAVRRHGLFAHAICSEENTFSCMEALAPSESLLCNWQGFMARQ